MIGFVMDWIKAHSPSGVMSWQGGVLYPEVTGYLIPTLLAYGERDLARQYADWLLDIQHADGSFDGIDGRKRTFDTSACYEGLMAMGEDSAADRAKHWLQALHMENGSLPIEPGGTQTHIYTARASGLINSTAGRDYWAFDGAWDTRWGKEQRSHYIAYGLEGLAMLGVDITPALAASHRLYARRLMPFRVGTDWLDLGYSDVTATCQMAMLYRRFGFDADMMIHAVEEVILPTAGVPQTGTDEYPVSWAAKYYLEAKRA